jgi:hypothetical protein
MGSGAPHLDPKAARAPRQKGKNRIIEQKATRTHTKKYREGVLRAIESERERKVGQQHPTAALGSGLFNQ